ncbi:uncharacterized protein LOC126212815 [Schistocerca nitens]|uniref:uncharacterized protein LOC126212815 n=1 Tax=Schistocerca nitens TaxID=7011 RepID=UPI0021173A47|nr:uncharacterized protein LOC126212815 [Schistocerca nitens]
MHPAGAAATLLALLAANGTSVLDCVCDHISRVTGAPGGSYGEKRLWWSYCRYPQSYDVYVKCDELAPPFAVVSAVAPLVPSSSSSPCGPPVGDEEEGCGGAVEAVRGLVRSTPDQLQTWHLCSVIADHCFHSCSAQGLNDTEWNAEVLATDHVRHPTLSELLRAARRITRAITARFPCALRNTLSFVRSSGLNETELQAEVATYLECLSSYWRDSAQLLSLSVENLSQLLVPLAFEHSGDHTNDQQLHVWIKDMERVRDMLLTKLSGWVRDVRSLSEQIPNYSVEEDQKNPGKYILRRPVLNEDLLTFHQEHPSFRSSFSALCEERQPEASQMFGLADALHSLYRFNLFYEIFTSGVGRIVDEEWQLEDRSNATLSVDTDCMQLLANALDHPTCPLDDLPPETVQQRQQCRVQLWEDMVQRSPHIPVTSYLAYTQRATVNLCLLAWMTANSFGICQDVPFSMMQSVHDARCYFDSPEDRSCLESNVTDAICSVSRAILLLKCNDFSFHKSLDVCIVHLYTNGSNSTTDKLSGLDGYEKATERTLNYKDSLSNATLKYKDFKIDSLKPLEISFIAVNIIFRFLTAGVYTYLPQLRNLPGMIFLSFQVTGIVQILCSEVMYRMAGVPDLATAVLVDSALTLLSCIWLNSFCYQMYACIRHLRLPNDLLPAEARKAFRRQVLYALIAWSIVCGASIALEKTSRYYLVHSRIIFLVGISLSIGYNLACLGLVGYMYLRNKKSMTQLKIYSNNKFGSKRQLFYVSVKTIILSGVCIIIRIGFHQAEGIAQFVYYVHIATMVQGPLLFVFFICNEATLPLLKNRLLACWNPHVISLQQELCSTAERNLALRENKQFLTVESSL